MPREALPIPFCGKSSANAPASASHGAAPAAISGREALWSAGLALFIRTWLLSRSATDGHLRDTKAASCTTRQTELAWAATGDWVSNEENLKLVVLIITRSLKNSPYSLPTVVYSTENHKPHNLEHHHNHHKFRIRRSIQ
jgi:hypothetical protein